VHAATTNIVYEQYGDWCTQWPLVGGRGLLHLGQRCPVSERVGTLFIKGHCKLVEFTNFTTSVMAQICKELKKY